MKKVVKDWFTGIDGQTYDLGRALWASAGATPLFAGIGQTVGTVASLFVHVPLHLWSANDWLQWSGGMSALLAAGAGALSLKKGTEPSTTTTRAGAATEQSNA